MLVYLVLRYTIGMTLLKILNKIAAKYLSNSIHFWLDQVVDECACGWEITLSACGGFPTVNNVIHMAYIMSLMAGAN